MKHTQSYIKDHPNPLWTRPNFMNLDGTWDFQFDPNNIGIKEGWHKGFNTSLTIRVPYAYQALKSGMTYDQPVNVVWYQKTLPLQKKPNKRILLHLEGSDFKTSIYINGQLVDTHLGSYHRLTSDITDYVNEQTTIVIRVEDSFSAEQPRGKQRWKTPSYECFYVETTGIYKSVWLEYVGDTYLSFSKLTPKPDCFLLQAEHQIIGNINDVQLTTEIIFNGKTISKSTNDVKKSFFLSSYDIKSDDQTMKIWLWHPNHPHLYDIVFTLTKHGKMIDQVTSYFGVRKFETHGKTILLNAVPIYLKMILDQGYFGDGHLTPTEDELIFDIQTTKAYGFNGARKHEKIEDQRYQYYCDILGLINWIEMPSFYEFSDQAMHYFSTEWQHVLKQYYNHPSVMTWVIFNESWGVMDIASSKKQQRFVNSMYELTKAYDQHRFVISNDGWEHTRSDLITLHNYRETYQELKEAYDEMDTVLSSQKNNHLLPKKPFVEGYHYHNQPVILSEFGGIAFEADTRKGWGYGNAVKTEDEFIDKLSGLMKAIKENTSFSGYCLTQLTDVQQEVNGILTENRKLKVSIDKLKTIL